MDHMITSCLIHLTSSHNTHSFDSQQEVYVA